MLFEIESTFFRVVLALNCFLLISFGSGRINERGKLMGENWMSMKELIQKVDSCRKRIPDELVRSYPVLVEGNGKYLVAFMYFYKRGVPPDAPKVSSPRYLMLVNPTSGDIVEFKRVKPEDFGYEWPESKPLGVHDFDTAMTVDEFLEMQEELYNLYDTVFALYRDRSEVSLTEKAKEMARFRELFNKLVEKPLIPYYKALNPDFYKWLDEQSR